MGAFKPLLPLGNSTFIEQIVNTLREGGVEKIAVVTGRDAPLIEERLAGSRINFIHNRDFAVTDMFYSASMGLRFMAEQVDGIFFNPADVPLFSAETVRSLAMRLQNTGGHIIIPVYRGRNGHPVAMKSCGIKELLVFDGKGGLGGAIEAYSGPKGVIEVEDAGILYDFDTPQDYRAAANPALKHTAPNL
jgi:CTP:molybdopterin cytidylyltransferase MocA